MKFIGPLYKIGNLNNPTPLLLSLYYDGGSTVLPNDGIGHMAIGSTFRVS